MSDYRHRSVNSEKVMIVAYQNECVETFGGVMTNDKLSSFLLEVSQNVPFYKKYFETNRDRNPINLADYPIISKKDICYEPDSFINKKFKKENLILKKTSGSTGIPLNVYKSQNDLLTQIKVLWKFRKREFNIEPSAKYLVFNLSRYSFESVNQRSKLVTSNILTINITGVSAEEFKKLSEVIFNFQPEFIMGTPTSVCDLIYIFEKYGEILPKSIRYVELMSEYLFAFQRDMIAHTFNCPISNHYGCTEVLGIAQQKKGCQDLSIFEENVFLENVENKILITGINSVTMPFIRYEIGDIGIVDQEKKSIELQAGRSNDLIFLDEINREHSATLCKIIDCVNSNLSQITRFKFYQKNFDLFEVYLSIKDESFQKTVKSLFKKAASNYEVLNNCKWVINFIPFDEFSILQEKNKFAYFVNEIKNNQ